MLENTINDFFDTLSEKTACFVEKKYLGDEHKNRLSLEIIKYKLNLYYRSLINYILLIVFSLMLKIPLLYLLVFMVFFTLTVRYAYGFHFSHSTYCILGSMVTCLSSLLLSIHVSFSLVQRVFICMLMVIIYLLFAPCETKTRPIPKRHRKELKIKSLIVCLGLIVISEFLYMFNNLTVYGNLALFSMVYRGVYILPFTKINEYYNKKRR